jgi:hypothetical protein
VLLDVFPEIFVEVDAGFLAGHGQYAGTAVYKDSCRRRAKTLNSGTYLYTAMRGTNSERTEEANMDFGQNTSEEVFAALRSLRDAGDPKGRTCERCGNKTKAGNVFGMIICNPCWQKQTQRKH